MGRSITQTLIATLPDSGVTAGSYTNSDITVNSQGIITTATDGTPSVTALETLTDVTITLAQTNDILQYNGSAWVDVELTIDASTDVTITTPVANDFLRYDGADWINETIAVLIVGDIGTTVQAWDAELDALAALAGTGYISQTGAATFVERTFTGTNGITVTNGDGVAGNTDLTVNIVGLSTTASIDSANDVLMLYNNDLTTNEKSTIDAVVGAAESLSGAISNGAGVSIYSGTTAKVLQFREIDAGSAAITVTLNVDTIEVDTSATLFALSGLATTSDGFIVGTGASWAVETGATARTSLGLGDMALETAADYLLLAGGTMAGALDMGTTNKIINLAEPTLAQDAATMNYVDTNVAVAGAGMTKTGSTLNVIGNADTSITVNADDIQLNTTFTDARYDARYHLQTELNSTTAASEGAALVGTDTKTGLNNATTVEVALTHLDTEVPAIKARFREAIDHWNTADANVTDATVNGVLVDRFANAVDAYIYKDFLLPPDFDGTADMTFYIAIAKETSAAGNIQLGLAWQHQRAPGFTVDSEVTFTPGLTSAVDSTTHNWVIAGGTFQALDVITLRFVRLGTSGSDTYTAGVDFFGAFITQ